MRGKSDERRGKTRVAGEGGEEAREGGSEKDTGGEIPRKSLSADGKLLDLLESPYARFATGETAGEEYRAFTSQVKINSHGNSALNSSGFARSLYSLARPLITKKREYAESTGITSEISAFH